MASIRNLKKDVKYLTKEIFTQCFIFIDLYPKANLEKVNQILADTIQLEKEIILKVNNIGEKHNIHLVRKHFKTLLEDLMVKSYNIFEEIHQLEKE